MASNRLDDYELGEDELRQLQFRLELTPAQRLELNHALMCERALKRKLARQLIGKLDLHQLCGPDNSDDYAVWLKNGRSFSIEDARRNLTGG